MPNASTTQSSSASDTTGQPIPLTYGYAWVTGKRAAYYTLQNTGLPGLDYSRVGIWQLGHGEWDGLIELWINDQLTWIGDTTVTNTWLGQRWYSTLDYPNQDIIFNFHSGCDSVIGSGLTPSSTGPDQGVDVLWAQLPPAIQPLAYSRIAYYALLRKQPVLYQTNNHQTDPTQWTDVAPIGLWRSLRCRLFDDEGNQTGYAFTTNPAWHFVDVLLRRKIYPDYGLDLVNGPDPLTAGVANRFDWGSIYTAAQYFDEFLSNGSRRFEGNYSFSQQTTLQAVLEQILLCCRSFSSEYGGKISINCDMPRSSVFTFSRDHILPGSWAASDQTLHKTANRFIANFRDLLVPACSTIASIDGLNVTTMEPHPFNAGDRIAIGGTNTPYDQNWQVHTVPAVLNPGTVDEIDPTTFTLVSQGWDYPTSVGSGGLIGLLYSRFKERSPEFWHKNNMLARGAIGLGIPRQRNKVKQVLDYATTTWDQASRLTCYERDRLLGIDQSPYVTPPVVKLRTSMFARDAFGNLACAVRPGDHVSIDSTVNFQYAGEYEVLDGLIVSAPSVQAKGNGGSIALTPDENSGEIEFPLGPYNPAVFYDTSDPTQAGWPSVPGSDPGNSSEFTVIPLVTGQAAFFSGAQQSGTPFQLPSTGYPAGNLIAWAAAASTTISYHSAHIIQLCEVATNNLLTLIYSDCEGNTWGGGLNFAAIAWLSSDVTTSSNGLTWIQLSLLGGEEILFGVGVLADGATIELPSGWSADQAFANAFIHDQGATGHIMYLAGAWVDAGFVVHCEATDHSGNIWPGNATVLVFAWKNNMGSITASTLGAGNWIQCTLTNGQVFGVGCVKNVANNSTLEIPEAAGDGATLQLIAGTSDSFYTSSGGHAQGIGACYVDADDVVHVTFNDGSGDTWPGTADIFALYCTSGLAVTTIVNVTPLSATVAAGAIFQFSAMVLNNANQNVAWSVDGIPGGNVTVGTIDATGNYAAPNVAGTHEITATSVADPSISGSAAVNVWGAVLEEGSILTDNTGDIIYADGDVIYVVED